MEELQPHEDHQCTANRPRHGAVEKEQIFPDKTRNYAERQQHEHRPETKGHGKFQDIGWR